MIDKIKNFLKTLHGFHCYHAEKVERFEIEVKSTCKLRNPYSRTKWRIFKYCCICDKRKAVIKNSGHLSISESKLYWKGNKFMMETFK